MTPTTEIPETAFQKHMREALDARCKEHADNILSLPASLEGLQTQLRIAMLDFYADMLKIDRTKWEYTQF